MPAQPPAVPHGLSMRVATGSISDSQHVLLTVVPPPTGPRPKLDVCVVVDTSYSMNEPANSNGPEEVRLFSKMDLAARAALVIARALDADDTLSIIAFSDNAARRLPRTPMDASGLSCAESIISCLRPDSGTNLWAGLHAGLEDVEDVMWGIDGTRAEARHGVVVLLTDGHPTSSPPAGEVAELARYMAARDATAAAKGSRPRAKLVTMGFGYSLNTRLLVDLAHTHREGESEFVFIPDGTMLLTNYMNLMANLRSTFARRVVLRITPPAPAAAVAAPAVDLPSAMDTAFTTCAPAAAAAATSTAATATAAAAAAAPTGAGAAATATAMPAPVPIDLPDLVSPVGAVTWRAVTTPQGAGLEIVLGNAQYGQELHTVLRERALGSAAGWQSWGLHLEYEALVPGAEAVGGGGGAVAAVVVADPACVSRQAHRALCVGALQTAVKRGGVDASGALALVRDAALATMSASEASPGGFVPHPILEDLTGQVSEALGSADAWQRWGCHFLPSLLQAHRAQACSNFKDPGLLAYVSDHVARVQVELNALCDTLPAPAPSLRTAIGRPVRAVTTSEFNAAFNNVRRGCFGHGTRVLLPGGARALVEDLRKGDRVAVPGGGSASVVCVVAYGDAVAVALPGSGLVITPWHPVRVSGVARWQFPANLMRAEVDAALARGGGDGGAAQLLAGCLRRPDRVYNLVLDGGHVVDVDGVEAVTLGHGLTDNVAAHPFFGTDAVVRQLAALPGWSNGWIALDSVARDPSTGLVAGVGVAAAAAASVVPVRTQQLA